MIGIEKKLPGGLVILELVVEARTFWSLASSSSTHLYC